MQKFYHIRIQNDENKVLQPSLLGICKFTLGRNISINSNGTYLPHNKSVQSEILRINVEKGRIYQIYFRPYQFAYCVLEKVKNGRK